MSDEGEKTCPLCAEEMDLTDQQLKPCRCGYEICVWCWHHIMDMAEKDDIEGRCPACRSPYDKEKIVGMAASCERLVSEINSGKKMKSQKSKTKPSEGRKQLSSVRVIQRNLVYIVGLPLDLADEDLLQNREYFGQYGKVMKVSMSRTASGVIQQFPNSTCSVYITYSKEEEAVRCIQSVHGFLLDGRSLRACFGTTKYCHAWLRNMPCSNLDCMYLHEIGSQEDSFTKDEIISAYTRNRVQQIMGPTNNLQRRSGNVLPPPGDEFCNSIPASAWKPIVKNPSDNTPSTVEDSPPNGSSCRSIALPAAASWGMHSSNCQTTASSLASLNGPTKNKSDTVNGTSAFSSAVASTTQAYPLPNDVDNKVSDDSVLHQHGVSILSNGYPENLVTRSTGLDRAAEGSFMVPNQGKGKHMERSHSNAATDAGESSIISDILSMDFDAWDDPLTSPQNLAKLWGETDKQPGSVRTGSRKIQNSNQSRFSFARQEDSRNKGLDVELPFNVTGQFPKNRSFDHGFSYNRDSYLDRFGSGNGFSANNLEELDNFSAGHSSISSNRQSVSRAQISTPPGFSIPSRAPPPGFSSHERMDQSFDTISGNHLLDTSSLLRNTFQAPQNGSIGSSNDIEFMDPAILAVGKGRFQGTLNSPGLDIRQNFPPQLSSVETDARLQLLMQRSLSHQNVRFPDVGERFSLGDSYGTPSRLMDQSQVNGLPSFGQLSIQQSRNGQMSNGHWDGWNEFHGGNNLGMAELLRNERLGYNKYYNGYEDSKFRMTSSGDLYNRTFGM